MLKLTSILFGIALSATASGDGSYVPLHEWEVHVNDRFIADTETNWGYIVSEDGMFTNFPIATGQNRYVYYLGRGYKASTPTGTWKVSSLHIKGDHVTFGPTGEFLRLYDEDGESTAYGIHSHRSIAVMLADSDRFRSMGCILVSDQALALLIETFELNGKSLDVATVHGLNLADL